MNKKNPGDPLAVQDLFLVAGTDLSFSGNPAQSVDGLFYATQQLKISGAPIINGAVMAYDSPTTAGSGELVLANEISGDPTITYGCGLTVPNTDGIDVVSWNEIIGYLLTNKLPVHQVAQPFRAVTTDRNRFSPPLFVPGNTHQI